MNPKPMHSAARLNDPVVSSAAPAGTPSRGGLTINPDTGLCTDYLNHFSEAIMVLEMLSTVPESIDDFLSWQPCSYTEHFAASNFKNRDAAIESYQAADPATRHQLDRLADTMNTLLSATLEIIAISDSPATTGSLAQTALAWLKPLVARASMVINGRTEGSGSKGEASAAQGAVDALMQR